MPFVKWAQLLNRAKTITLGPCSLSVGLESEYVVKAHQGDHQMCRMSGLAPDLLSQNLHLHKQRSSSAPASSDADFTLLFPLGSSFTGQGTLLWLSKSKAAAKKSFENAQISDCNRGGAVYSKVLCKLNVALRSEITLPPWICSGLWLLWSAACGESDATARLHKDKPLLPWFPSALKHHARNQTTHGEGSKEGPRKGSASIWRRGAPLRPASSCPHQSTKNETEAFLDSPA